MNNAPKIFLLIFLFSFSPTIIYGQDPDSVKSDPNTEMKTLLSLPKLPKLNSLGFYLVPEYQYGRLAGQFTSMGGGSAMVVLNKSISVGLSGYSTFHNFTPSEISTNHDLQLRTQFGGAKIEYTLNPNNAIHFSFPLLIGGGRASIDSAGRGRGHDNRGPFTRYGGPPGNQVSFFLVQPGVNIEANLLRFVKVFTGVSYRIVSGGESRSSTNLLPGPPYLGQLQGISFNAGIKIGLDFQLHRKRNQ